MTSRFILFILGFIVWIGLNWPPNSERVLMGILTAGFVAFLMGDLFIRKPYSLRNATRYIWFLYYIPLFLWECLKANIDVAYRVIHPNIPIKPGIVKVKTILKSNTALTLLANSITLTPGTMSVDVDKNKGFLYIHWINVKDADIEIATKLIVKKFEDVLKRIFE